MALLLAIETFLRRLLRAFSSWMPNLVADSAAASEDAWVWAFGFVVAILRVSGDFG